MVLTEASQGDIYTIQGIDTNDEELNDFLFTLGCYSGENITLVSRVGESYTISIKDARYNIDRELAEAILINY